MPAESYDDIEATLDRLLESTEEVLHRMQQVMRGEIAQDPQIMARTLADSLELTLESQRATKAMLVLLKAQTD